MPSGCAALTSAPCLSSARTPSTLPRLAASATTGGAATCAIAATDTRQLARKRIVVLARMRFPFVSFVSFASSALVVEREFARAVAEALVFHAEHVHGGEHRVGHRRSVRRLEVQTALELAVG